MISGPVEVAGRFKGAPLAVFDAEIASLAEFGFYNHPAFCLCHRSFIRAVRSQAIKYIAVSVYVRKI
jgi:hypothetical protein